jgi:hypothetical protein
MEESCVSRIDQAKQPRTSERREVRGGIVPGSSTLHRAKREGSKALALSWRLKSDGFGKSERTR